MYYVQIVLLLVLIFLILNDKKVKDINELSIEKEKILEVIDNLKIINLDREEISKLQMTDIKTDSKYVLMKNKDISINDKSLNTIVANFIDINYEICGFNINYKLDNKVRNILKKAYVALINYLLLFQKHNILSYGVILFKIEDFSKVKNITSFMADDKILNYSIDNSNIKKLKTIYKDSLKHMDFIMGLKTVLTIFTGSVICTSLIYNFINISYDNYMDFLISVTLYYCYTYILNYIYKPMGRYKVLVSYIFPLYILIFVILSVINPNLRE